MNQLPRAARYYVTAVIAIGVGAVRRSACRRRRSISRCSSSRCSRSRRCRPSLKVYLPLTTSGSTMSVSYAVDFASLLLLGPHETMLVAAGSAFSQCHLNSKERNPLYRTLFSMASLVITVQGAGLAFHLLGGGAHTPMSLTALARPLVGAATVYFLLNTGLIATAIALSTRDADRQHLAQQLPVERAELFRRRRLPRRSRPGSSRHAGYWVAPLTFAPLYLTYRTYKVYMGRIEDEQRHVQQTSDLHLATIEALARAIDAKDQTTQIAHPARADVRRRPGEGARAVGRPRSRASRPRRCCTTSASSRCPSTSCRSPGR